MNSKDENKICMGVYFLIVLKFLLRMQLVSNKDAKLLHKKVGNKKCHILNLRKNSRISLLFYLQIAWLISFSENLSLFRYLFVQLSAPIIVVTEVNFYNLDIVNVGFEAVVHSYSLSV